MSHSAAKTRSAPRRSSRKSCTSAVRGGAAGDVVPVTNGRSLWVAGSGRIGERRAARARPAGIDVVAIRGHRPNARGSVADRLLAPARLLSHALELRALARAVEPDAVVG